MTETPSVPARLSPPASLMTLQCAGRVHVSRAQRLQTVSM